MVKFELLIHLNNQININENSLEIATVLTNAGFNNIVTANNIIIFDNEKANITINPNICVFNIKAEMDWGSFNEYFKLIEEIIKCLSNEKVKPIINLHLLKIVELNNNIYIISKRNTNFDYFKESIFKDVIGVGFRFFEKSESGSLSEFKVEPWIKNPKCLYLEANYIFNTFDEVKTTDNSYKNFEDKIEYFTNQYK